MSHTGGSYRGGGAKNPTASLGLLYDMSYNGPGLKVVEIVAGGPFSRESTQLKPGAVITKLNGKELAKDSDPLSELNSMSGKKRSSHLRIPTGRCTMR